MFLLYGQKGHVFGRFLHSRFMPCPACGISLERLADDDQHECDPEKRVDYLLFHLRHEVELLESGIVAYLDSARGRFELWYAERQRLRRDEDDAG
jgi:hypothetical protein